jgi:hypothetical protein
MASEVLAAVRREKTVAKRSMRARVARCIVVDTPARLADLARAQGDLLDAGGIDDLVLQEGEVPSVTVELAADG